MAKNIKMFTQSNLKLSKNRLGTLEYQKIINQTSKIRKITKTFFLVIRMKMTY